MADALAIVPCNWHIFLSVSIFLSISLNGGSMEGVATPHTIVAAPARAAPPLSSQGSPKGHSRWILTIDPEHVCASCVFNDETMKGYS